MPTIFSHRIILLLLLLLLLLTRFYFLAFIYIPFGETFQETIDSLGFSFLTPSTGWQEGVINIDEAFITPLIVTQFLNLLLETFVPYLVHNLKKREERKLVQRYHKFSDITATLTGGVRKITDKVSQARDNIRSHVTFNTQKNENEDSNDHKEELIIQNLDEVKAHDDSTELSAGTNADAGKSLNQDSAGTGLSIIAETETQPQITPMESQVEEPNKKTESVSGSKVIPVGNKQKSHAKFRSSKALTEEEINGPIRDENGIIDVHALSLIVSKQLDIDPIPVVRKCTDSNQLDAFRLFIQSQRGDFDPFSDYLDMVIQFSYLTMFTATWPFIPLAAFLNNLLELRADMFKLMYSRRPVPRHENAIGEWLPAIKTQNIIAVMVVSAMIIYSTGSLENFYPNCMHELNEKELMSPDFNCFNSWDTRIMWGLVLEHLGFLIVFLIRTQVPDCPPEVKTAVKVQDTLQRRLLQNRMVLSLPEQLRAAVKEAFEDCKKNSSRANEITTIGLYDESHEVCEQALYILVFFSSFLFLFNTRWKTLN